VPVAATSAVVVVLYQDGMGVGENDPELFVPGSPPKYVKFDGRVMLTCAMSTDGLLMVKFTSTLIVPALIVDCPMAAVKVAA